MSHTIEQAEELRQRAITILLQEREAIDEKLAQLGYDGTAKQVKRACSRCGADDHTARKCPTKETVEAPGAIAR